MVSQSMAASSAQVRPQGQIGFAAVTAIVVTAAMLFFGTGLHPLWWLTWWAPIPVLWASTRLSRRTAFVASAIAWFVGGLNMWRYFLKALEMPLAIVLVLSVIPALLFGLVALSFRRFAVRGALWHAALIVPAFWVTIEYINYATSRHGTFPNLAYTQMDFLPVLQIASLVGIWGISFCVMLFAATVAAVVIPADVRQRKMLGISVAVVLAVVLGFGWWRVHSTPPSKHTIRVGLMASGVNSPYPYDDVASLALLQDYANKSEALAARGAQLIVLPEKIAVISEQGAKQMDVVFEAAAARSRASILVGVDVGTATKRSNEARLYSPAGEVAAVYHKHHLVPRFEDVDQPGTTTSILYQPSGMWGIEICKDMDFPQLSREYADKNVGLLLAPAWDFTMDAWLHGRMAVLRGVESGFTIVRAAKQGLLTVSDDRGRILAEADAATVPFGSLIASAPARYDKTLYARWGDWFAWVTIGGFVMLMFSVAARKATIN